MKKNPKEALGIFQDGNIIRMVHLSKDGADTYLLGRDSIQLERDWYRGDQAVASSPDAEFIPLDAEYIDAEELDMGDISTDDIDQNRNQPKIEVSPTTMMFAKFPMQEAVIALNIYEQFILKDEPGLTDKRDLRRFRKDKLSSPQAKAGQWQSCVVKSEEEERHWLYTGPNLLLDEIQDYAKEANIRVYFQLAEANDVVLTDYFRYTRESDSAGLSLLVYLGHEYRKIYVFQDGEWVSTLPIHITQQIPEPEVIYSKLALALDTAELGEPEEIILAGNLAGRNLVEYMTSQSMSTKTSLLKYPNLVVTDDENPELQDQTLAPYSLALALAYKALNFEDPSFSNANFLPSRILDNQKELKVVWHGFIVLTLIFALVLYSTQQFLRRQDEVRQERRTNADLIGTLNQLRAENAIVEQLHLDIDRLKEKSNIVGQILEGKNRWTEMFDILNGTFATYPQSWISNLRQNGELIMVSGVTSRRENVSRLASNLPDSKILRVTNSKIRDRVVWNFELEFSLPEYDWEDRIAAEYVPPVTQTKRSTNSYRSARNSETPPKEEQHLERAISYTFGMLPRFDQANVPDMNSKAQEQEGELLELFGDFAKAINEGNMLEYRFVGHSLINNYPDSELLPLVRWWLAYRLYLENELRLSHQVLQPNLQKVDECHPHNLLLEARLAYASEDSAFLQTYKSLLRNYPDSPAARQGRLDLSIIEKGAVR